MRGARHRDTHKLSAKIAEFAASGGGHVSAGVRDSAEEEARAARAMLDGEQERPIDPDADGRWHRYADHADHDGLRRGSLGAGFVERDVTDDVPFLRLEAAATQAGTA